MIRISTFFLFFFVRKPQQLELPVLFRTLPLVDDVFPDSHATLAVYCVIHDQLEVLRILTSLNPVLSPLSPNVTSIKSSTR